MLYNLIDYRQIRFELGTAAAVLVILLPLLKLWIAAINGYEWERMRFHLPDLLVGSSKAFLLSPWFVVSLLTSVWVLWWKAAWGPSVQDC